MVKSLFVIIVVLLISSCSQQKLISTKSYVWENKMVTKKEYDSLLYNHTVNFIKTYSKEK